MIDVQLTELSNLEAGFRLKLYASSKTEIHGVVFEETLPIYKSHLLDLEKLLFPL